MALPNLVVIGAPKCGTTSLHAWLVQHPEVVGSTRKEAQYLVDRGSSIFRAESNIHLHGLDRYAAMFAERAVILDSTPGYLYQKVALDVLSDQLTNARLVVVVRDPVLRFVSAHRYYTHVQPILDPAVSAMELFERCLSNDETLPSNEFVRGALAHGEYTRYLDLWSSRCGPERMRVISADALRSDPGSVLRGLAEWCAIDPAGFAQATLDDQNVGYAVRSHRLHGLVRSWRKWVPAGPARQFARRLYRRLNVTDVGATSGADPRLVRALADHYADWNEALASRYRIDVATWGEARQPNGRP